MSLPVVNLDQRIRLVCSADPSVTLRPLKEQPPLPTGPGEAPKETPPKPPARESRRPVRWLRVEDVEVFSRESTVVEVRLLDSDEQFFVTGGLAMMSREASGPAARKAIGLCVKSVTGPGLDARTDAEVAKWLRGLHIMHAEPLGAWIVDESCGYNIPFDASA